MLMEKIKNFSVAILMAFVSVCFLACSKSSDDPVDVASVVGSWVCIASTDSWDGGSTTGYMVDEVLTVKSDGTYQSTSSSMGLSGTWTLTGNSFSAKSSSGRIFNASVSVSSTTLQMNGSTNDGYKFNYTFKKK